MLLFLLSFSVFGLLNGCQGQTYEETAAIHKMRQSIENYTVNVRPLRNQSEIIVVWVHFVLLNIIKVDDVSQSFTANGFFTLLWKDEILKWDAAEYGGEILIVPDKKEVWFPRLMLWNTLEGRDFFSEDPAPLLATAEGETVWIPGGPFSISCSLDMSNYPFDDQVCVAEITSMDYRADKLMFIPHAEDFDRKYYTVNEEWDLVDVKTVIETINSSSEELPSFQIIFHIERKAAAFLLSVIIPAVFLSFLNLLVFVIPVDAGEKISYGITVSLALVLSMTFISENLPRSSSPIPKVTIYLFTLLMMSFSIVVVSIIIVFLHHMEEKEEKHQRVAEKVQTAVEKFSNFRRVVTTTGNRKSGQENMADDHPFETRGDNNENIILKQQKSNKYKVIGKYINVTSFVIFLLVWLGLTVGLSLSIAL